MPEGERVQALSTASRPLDASRVPLDQGDLDVVGRLTDASNATLFAVLRAAAGEVPVVYKPVAGERPLRDFRHATLHRREVATYRLDVAAGFATVPETVLRDGPFGLGSVQRWVGPAPGEPVEAGAGVVDVLAVDEVPPGWLEVVRAYDQLGEEVVLCHADDERLARMAVLDVMANNADRKGGHVLEAGSGKVAGVDHGLTFHTDDKLRTVLWGWAGRPVPQLLLDAVQEVADQLGSGPLGAELSELLDPDEVQALDRRCRRLLRGGRFPRPGGGGPSIPWPAF